MTVTMVLTSVGLAAEGSDDVDLLLQLIPRDIMRVSVGLTTMQHQHPQSKMPFQAMPIMPWVLFR